MKLKCNYKRLLSIYNKESGYVYVGFVDTRRTDKFMTVFIWYCCFGCCCKGCLSHTANIKLFYIWNREKTALTGNHQVHIKYLKCCKERVHESTYKMVCKVISPALLFIAVIMKIISLCKRRL